MASIPFTCDLFRQCEQVDAARQARGFRHHLAYLLVQTAPRLQLGAADEGRCLADTGVQPRTSLQVIPHAALGHQPPAPAPEPQQQQPAAAEPPQPAAPAAETREAAAAAPAAPTAPAAAAVPTAAAPKAKQQQPVLSPPPPPAEVALQVRLSNDNSLRRVFPGTATLSDVLDWVDANRTDRWALASCTDKWVLAGCAGGLLVPRWQLCSDAAPHGQRYQWDVCRSPAPLTSSTCPGWLCRGAYKLTQTFPARTFFSGDIGKSLQVRQGVAWGASGQGAAFGGRVRRKGDAAHAEHAR